MIPFTARPARNRTIATDRSGATIVEFGLVAPAFMMVLVASFDIGHTLYVRSALQGIVQKVARDSSLEAGTEAATQTALDNKVRAQTIALANNATITFSRRFYRTFSAASAAQAEPWTDTNANGRCDAGEPYQDNNLNGTWDADGGDSGQGGAKDKTLYTVTVSYPRFFPLWRFIGGATTTVVSATTVLANQPYSDQGSYGTSIVRNCP